jgi:putative ABC transport system permease protein
LAFGEGYQRGLRTELDSMGMQMMLVPLGCPYDAAARVIKGKTLEVSLPASALQTVRKDPAVEVAAPLLMATLPRPKENRTDLWVGVDESAQTLKPWWKLQEGGSWFKNANSVILGAEAAHAELRQVGDTLYSPETGRKFTVVGILKRSGTSDDSMFFVPLATAQAMFGQEGRLTAVAIRLKDPTLLDDVSQRLQKIKGAQVATLTEMMGTFLNLVGSVRTLVFAIAIVAVTISCLAVFNTMLSAVLERTSELGVLRAVGASRSDLFGLLALEALLLTVLGSLIGVVFAWGGGSLIERGVRRLLPFAGENALLNLTPNVVGQCLLIGLGVGVFAGLYPAWQASRLQPVEALRTE